jgi:hypothetical protein
MRKPVWFLSLALLGSLALSAWLWQELREAQALNRELDARLAAPGVPALPQPAVAPPPSTSPVLAAPASSAALPAPEVTPNVPGMTREQQWANHQQRLLRDARYREAWKQQWRINHAPRRENLVRVVGLSAEQADAVFELQVEQELKSFENAGGGVDPVDAEGQRQLEARQEAAEAEFQARLQKYLGPDKYERLESYMESRQTRMQVDRFRTGLNAADMLRDDQVEPLISALHAEQHRFQQELNEYRETLDWNSDPMSSMRQYDQRKNELSKEAHARMHSGASAILTTAQLDELDAMLRRDRDREASRQQMIQLRSKIDTGAQAAGAD